MDCLIVFRLSPFISICSGSSATCFSVQWKNFIFFLQNKKGLLTPYLNGHHAPFAAWHALLVLPHHHGQASSCRAKTQARSFDLFQHVQGLCPHFGHHHLSFCITSCSIV